jgi:hypothetical protein
MKHGEEQDPDALADRLEHQADELEQRSEQLGERVGEVRQDWERKRADEGVPGANPPPQEDQASREGPAPPVGEAGDEQAEDSE